MRLMIILGAISALMAVIFGALAAHGLDGVLGERALESFKTAVQYQMYHSLAVLLVIALPQLHARLARLASVCFLSGIVLFSGSIYLLTLAGLSWLGPVTPVGGGIMIVGWLLVIVATIKGARNV